MNTDLVCWKCGASLEELPLPLSRLAECAACRAEQHVCRMCVFYDTSVSRSCREPVAEDVTNKERANFCGYFQPRQNAFDPATKQGADTATAALAALFGDAPDSGNDDPDAGSNQALDDLFGPKD